MEARAFSIAATFALGACGRLGFATIDDDTGDAAHDGPSTGIQGARWLHNLGPAVNAPKVAGVNGEVVAAITFATSLVTDGPTLTGVASSGSTGVIRYDVDGTLEWSTVLDAPTWCDIRGISMRGTSAIVAGFAAGTSMPALGPCSVPAGGRQTPVVLSVDAVGQPQLIAQFPSAGANAQAWRAAPLADGSIAVSGVYGSGLTIGSALPAAQFDPNGYVARINDAVTTPVWATGLDAGFRVLGGPIVGDGVEVCAVGTMAGAATLFGRALPNVGGTDGWVARLDQTGAPKFVRGFGSTGDEPQGDTMAAAPTASGGCWVAMLAPGAVSIDAVSVPGTTGAVLLQFDAAGTAITGARLPGVTDLAVVGGKIYGAFTVTSPIMIGQDLVTPSGSDVVVVELDATGPTRLIAQIGGAGTQSAGRIASAGSGALAIGVSSSGALVFGTTTLDSGATTIQAVAAVGL